MSSKRRRDAENVTPDFSFMDDKNKKAQWQEEGGEPLYMTKRFKDLRFQFLMITVIMLGLAVISVLIIIKKAPPGRIVLTVQMLGPFCLMGLLPLVLMITKYSKSDEVVIKMVYLIVISTLIVGYSLDFIVGHVLMQRAVYGDTQT